MKLTFSDRWLVANSLRIAANQYDKDAKVLTDKRRTGATRAPGQAILRASERGAHLGGSL